MQLFTVFTFILSYNFCLRYLKIHIFKIDHTFIRPFIKQMRMSHSLKNKSRNYLLHMQLHNIFNYFNLSVSTNASTLIFMVRKAGS